MSLSCSKIIRSSDVDIKGKVTLKNNITSKIKIEEQKNIENNLIEKEKELRLKIIDSEKKYKDIISKFNEDKLKIIDDAKIKALEIEKKAYEEGYSQGIKNGYEDGYKEAYEENIEKVKLDSKEIIDNASKVLYEAKNYVSEYMKENKKNILSLSVSIAEQVLREKFKDTHSMDNIIKSVIEEHELKESFIIKVNPIYKESLSQEIIKLKESYKLKSDVFILSDESIEEGNAIIETSKGRLIIGVDSVLNEIKEELL